MPLPPPTVIFADNFSSYPVGSFPTGWQGDNSAVVQAGNSPNFYHQMSLGGPGSSYRDLGNLYSNVSVFFAFFYDAHSLSFGPVFSFNNGEATILNSLTTLASLKIETDQTLSISQGTEIIQNSQKTINNGWNYVQINASFSTQMVLGITYITFTGGVSLNGESIIASCFGVTGIKLAQLYYGQAAFNEWTFNPFNFTGGTFADVSFCQLTPLNNYPFTTNPFGRVSQAIVEVIELPESYSSSTTNLRMSQGVVEVAELPHLLLDNEFPNLRVSQCVIELMTDNTSIIPPASGWNVSES